MQARAGNEATQAMLIVGNQRFSRIEICLKAAPFFLLSDDEAVALAEHQIEVISARWDPVCAEAQLSEVDRSLMWRRQFLNPFVFENAPPTLAALVQ
jgi:serine/threonine-protein kinase HipA